MIARIAIVPLTLLAALLLSGCRDEGARAKIRELEARNSKLTQDIDSLRMALRSLVPAEYPHKVVEIDPTTKGYAYVDCEAGRLLMSCVGAEPYLDGHKIILRIGNPMNMSFSGFKLKVRFGARAPEAKVPEGSVLDGLLALGKAERQWRKTLKEQEMSFVETLSPGALTKVELVLSPSKPEEVRYIGIEIETGTVALAGPY